MQKTRANKFVLFGFDQFQGAFLSTCFLARGLALFQQFVNDAGSLDSKKQDLKVAQSVVDDCATVRWPHQFELPLDCNDDVEMFRVTGDFFAWKGRLD